MDLIKEYGLKVDERIQQSKKEAIQFIISWVIMSVWSWAWAFYGASNSPTEYTYIFGIPKWFFMVTVVTVVVYPIFLIIQALRVKDCNLNATGSNEE